MSIDNILSHPSLAGMREQNRFIVYLLTPSKRKAGKMDKVPVHYETCHPASVTDPANWTSAERAAVSARAWGSTFGVGYVFDGSLNEFFVDLDDALQPDGTWSPLAQQACQIFNGAAVEISSSGKGLHIFGRATLPAHCNKNLQHHAELYSRDRFVALSGLSLMGDSRTDHTAALGWFAQTYFPPRADSGAAGEPFADDVPDPRWKGPEDDNELIRRALRSTSAGAAFGDKASFADLWLADAAVLARAYPDSGDRAYDASSADAALAQHLAFWAGRWPSRIERLMRMSKLARDKWSRDDYLQRTITNACKLQRDVLVDKPPAAPPQPLAQDPAPPPGPAGMLTAQALALQPLAGTTFLDGPAQQAHFAGCCYVRDQHRVLTPGGALLKPDQFKAIYGRRTFVMDALGQRTTRNAFEAFTESQLLQAPVADQVCFQPALPYGTIITRGGMTLVNSYSRPHVERKTGDVTPFMNHLAKLVPDPTERAYVFYNLACLVQRQGYKAQFALVLQGVEGNGKSLLTKFVARAIGEKHVYHPRADKITAGFNHWLVGHTLYVVDEIYVGDSQDTIDVLKPMITADSGIEIEKKGVDQFSSEIVGNFLFTTNHKHALRKTLNDRRWFVVYTAQQSYADLQRDGMLGQYMNDMHDWARNGGYAAVAELLWTVEIPPEYDFSKKLQRAPITVSSAAAVEATRGSAEQEILDAVERDEPGFRGGWVSSHWLDRLLARIGRDKAVPLNRRREMLESLGYLWHPALPNGRVNNIVLPDGMKSKLFVRADRADLLALSAAEVPARYCRDQGAT